MTVVPADAENPVTLTVLTPHWPRTTGFTDSSVGERIVTVTTMVPSGAMGLVPAACPLTTTVAVVPVNVQIARIVSVTVLPTGKAPKSPELPTVAVQTPGG